MTDKYEMEEIFSKKVRAGRRTYFFDVRSTKAGDYYMTMTESIKDTNDQGVPSYRKHKIYLYKEDFEGFADMLEEVTSFIVDEKGEEVISERHQKDFKKEYDSDDEEKPAEKFTNVSFDDI